MGGVHGSEEGEGVQDDYEPLIGFKLLELGGFGIGGIGKDGHLFLWEKSWVLEISFFYFFFLFF